MILQVLSPLLFLFAFFQQPRSSLAPAPPQQAFRISGTVVDSLSGQPLSRAQVLIGALGIPNSDQAVTTGDDGRFAFESLVPGHYTLSAQRRGYLAQAFKQHEFFSTAIIVGPNLDTSELRFELRPDASISGQILDEMNDPVRNAQVLLFCQGLRSGVRTTWQERLASTDDQGNYHFGHLDPGTYFIATSAQPWYAQRVTRQLLQRVDGAGQITYEEVTNGEPALDVLYPITFFSNTSDISGAVPITLRSGDAQTTDVTLRPVPALHLVIRSPSSGESENLWAQVSQPLIDGVQQQLQANVQQVGPGIVEVSGLPPGRLNLALHFSKENESTTRSHTIQLAADAEINASETAPSVTVGGMIKMDDGSSLPQPALFQLHNRTTGENFNVQTEPSGEFSLRDQPVTAGTYDALLLGPPAAAVKSLSATGAKASGHTLEIGAGQDVKLTVVISKGTGEVTGVALKDGKPVDGVMVVLVPEVPEHNLLLFRRDQSDSDGSFNLGGILPGRYTVVAIENGWELDWLTPAVLQKYLLGGEAVQVRADSRIEVKVNVQQ
jgi:Carboxypeptidase regulatory-like domain